VVVQSNANYDVCKAVCVDIASAGDVVTAVSQNISLLSNAYATVTTEVDLPSATDRTGKHIVGIITDGGLLLPCYTDASEPAGTGAEGAIWYARDAASAAKFKGSDGGQNNLGT